MLRVAEDSSGDVALCDVLKEKEEKAVHRRFPKGDSRVRQPTVEVDATNEAAKMFELLKGTSITAILRANFGLITTIFCLHYL